MSDRVLKPKTDHRPPRTAPSPGAATAFDWARKRVRLRNMDTVERLSITRAARVVRLASEVVPEEIDAELRDLGYHYAQLADDAKALRIVSDHQAAALARVFAACDEIAHRASLADADEDPAAAALWAALGLVRTALQGDVSDGE